MPTVHSRARSRNPISARVAELLSLACLLARRPRGCDLNNGRIRLFKCSLGLNRLRTWLENVRSAGSSSINKPTPPKTL
jgi:hypothetical protein